VTSKSCDILLLQAAIQKLHRCKAIQTKTVLLYGKYSDRTGWNDEGEVWPPLENGGGSHPPKMIDHWPTAFLQTATERFPAVQAAEPVLPALANLRSARVISEADDAPIVSAPDTARAMAGASKKKMVRSVLLGALALLAGITAFVVLQLCIVQSFWMHAMLLRLNPRMVSRSSDLEAMGMVCEILFPLFLLTGLTLLLRAARFFLVRPR